MTDREYLSDVNPAKRPKASVIVPVLNTRRYLEKCLDSILAAIRLYGPAELIVIDNGSTDGSYELLQEKYAPLATIRQIQGRTVASLRNFGACVSSGQYLSFIDSDCVIPVEYLQDVADVFASIDTDATGCMYDLPPEPCWIEETWQELHQRRQDGFVRFINSGNFAIKRSVFERTRGFDERLTTGEDAEYCLRLVATGYKIYESHRISAAHLGNPKNLVSFFKKHSWHGLGMLGSLRLSWFDKPLWMTCSFLLLSVAGGIVLLFFPGGLGVRVGAFVLSSTLVPVVTVFYRASRTGRLFRPLRSVLLYWLYYAARSHALFLISFRYTRKAMCRAK